MPERKSKKISRCYREMDIDFDYSDWSDVKTKKHSTPARKNLEPLLNRSESSFCHDISVFNHEDDEVTESRKPESNNFITSNRLKEQSSRDLDFNCGFNEDDLDLSPDENEIEVTKIENTPEKQCPSPDVFDRSPIIQRIPFPKKLVFRPRSLLNSAVSEPLSSVSATISKDFDSRQTHPDGFYPRDILSASRETQKLISSHAASSDVTENSKFNSSVNAGIVKKRNEIVSEFPPVPDSRFARREENMNNSSCDGIGELPLVFELFSCQKY